ncbi:hypothetical protein SLEP1_g58760 [Rubroshorea leprosula]|uniref:Uncharacterized protein n=1 Tax=Rubroshorea leprosula TaxID=152421 RepID=A0AAV5MSV1_9ROSI|nr:hypothetical protein SLEP1_g58760 [Rubroshorea leprosula]
MLQRWRNLMVQNFSHSPNHNTWAIGMTTRFGKVG